MAIGGGNSMVYPLTASSSATGRHDGRGGMRSCRGTGIPACGVPWDSGHRQVCLCCHSAHLVCGIHPGVSRTKMDAR